MPRIIISTDPDYHIDIEWAEYIRGLVAKFWEDQNAPLILGAGLHAFLVWDDGTVRRVCHHDPEPTLLAEAV